MKVKDLITMLGQCPPNMDVMIAYDSLVCIYNITRADSFILHENSEYRPRGVYLTAGGGCYRKDCGGVKITPRQKEAK